MFTVYLGLQDKSTVSNSNISPAQSKSVYTAIKVNIFMLKSQI